MDARYVQSVILVITLMYLKIKNSESMNAAGITLYNVDFSR